MHWTKKWFTPFSRVHNSYWRDSSWCILVEQEQEKNIIIIQLKDYHQFAANRITWWMHSVLKSTLSKKSFTIKTKNYHNSKNRFKWRILSQPTKIESGKNKKSLFFLLGLKITLRTCFESNRFSSNFCPELSNQVLSFSEGQIY